MGDAITEPVLKRLLEEQADTILHAVKEGFDGVDERFKIIENDIQALHSAMVTKEYLDEKIDQLLYAQHQDALFKRRLLLALEESNAIAPATRAKLEKLVPALQFDE